jgi:hypothetical protein
MTRLLMIRLPRFLLLAILFVGIAVPASAQEDASSGKLDGFDKIDGTRLKPATLTYDATMKMKGRSRNLSSTLTYVKTTTSGTDTWTLVNKIKTSRGTSTDSLIADRSSLLPVSRHRRGGAGMDLTYTGPSESGETEAGSTMVSGTVKPGGQSRQISTSVKGPTLAGGLHDVIALGAMPLEPGFEATLQVFSPQDQATKRAEFETVGTETVETPAGSFETYVVDLDVGDGYVTGTVHLRKEAPRYYVKWKTKVQAGRGTRTLTQTLSSMEMGSPSSGQ